MKSNFAFFALVWSAVNACGATAPAVDAPTSAAPTTAARRPEAPVAPVVFDWFEYTGRDEVFTQPLPEGSYRNPILAGFYPDPSICRVGDDFYLVNSTFAYFPGIPIFHSRDLVNWRQLGHVIARPEQLEYTGLGVSRGIFAPAISHHDGVFFVVCTMVDAGGNFLVTANDPAGPWSDPVWLGFEGIDPSLFFDDDGRAWLVNNGAPPGEPQYDGHRAIWIQQFDIAARRLVGPRRVLVNGGVNLAEQPVWIEGPHLYRRGDWYYLCCAEGGTAEDHRQVIFRGRAPTGPFEPWTGNPILTQRNLPATARGAVTSTGHADLVVGPDDNWWAVFLGCRPYSGRYYATGRETFLLPVTWTDDGWPVILPKGKRVPLVVPAPVAPPAEPGGSEPEGTGPGATVPLTGNFTWRDGFDRESLSPAWIMLRSPAETWWQLAPNEGGVRLTPRAEGLSGTGNPTYLGRRVQHARFDASVALRVPEDPDVSAGLVLFQAEHYHYYLGVRRGVGPGLKLFIERHEGDAGKVIAEAAIARGEAGPDVIRLRAAVDDAKLQFGFALGEEEEWRTLVREADARILTTQAAGGFVGATVGMHARVERQSGGEAR